MFAIAVLITLFGAAVRAQQCYEAVNSLLASGNAISPYTVLLQLEFTQQAITSGAVSVTDSIAQFCSAVSETNESQFCAGFQSSAQGPAIVTQAAVGTLNALMDCVQAFINGAPDYQLAAGSYFNFPGSSVPPPSSSSSSSAGVLPSPVVRSGGQKKRSSVYKTLVSGDTKLDFSTYPVKSPNGFSSSKRQQSSCSTVVDCYTTCRSCQSRDAICEGAAVGTAAICGTVAETTARTLGTIALGAACVAGSGLCGPFAIICVTGCTIGLPNIINSVTNDACERARANACPYAISQCNNCRASNPGICDPNTSQCCPTETGTRCGADCCCCGLGFAPRGPNCECVPSA